MTMAAKNPIFLFMEIVIHSFLTEGSMITPLCCNTCDMMIPGSKGLKSDEGLHEGGFLNLGPAKNMSKEPFFEEK